MIDILIGSKIDRVDVKEFPYLAKESMEVNKLGDTVYFSNYNDGISLNVSEISREIIAIYLYGYSEDADKFKDELPYGLGFDMGKKAVYGILGLPSRSFPACKDPMLGERLSSDRFDMSGYVLNIQYCSDKDRINRIAITRS